MKLAFNQATTLENSTLEKDLELCEQQGYDYIEIRTMDKLPEYLETNTMADLKNFFDTHQLKPLALNALVFFNNRDEEGHQEIIQEFKAMLVTAQELNVPYIVAVPLVTKTKFHKQTIQQDCVAVLREMSDLAKASGVKIALEFVGHPECTVNTFGQAYDIIEAVDRENVGVVFDCFHFHAMGSNIADLERAKGDKIFILHMDDTEDYPIGFLTDDDRVWPGHGAIDLETHLKTLRKIGFKGVASVELFRPEYYQMSAEEVIRKAKDTTREVLQAYY